MVAPAPVTYTVTVTNNGPNTAYNVELTDNVPADMSFVSVTSPVGWACLAPVGGQYSCTAASLVSSASAVFTMVHQANYCTGAAATTHTVTVSSLTPDPDLADNQSDLVTNITDPGICSDNDACTQVDVCVGGVCIGSSPVVCDDGDACTTEACNPGTGQCVAGSPVDCDDANSCTDDSCDPVLGCAWVNNDANSCSDGDLCTTPALPADWSTTLVSGLGGDIAFETSSTASDTAPNAAFTDAPDHLTDKVLDSPAVTIVTTTAQLTFAHSYDLEVGFDGAVLEISIGGQTVRQIQTE